MTSADGLSYTQREQTRCESKLADTTFGMQTRLLLARISSSIIGGYEVLGQTFRCLSKKNSAIGGGRRFALDGLHDNIHF